ncbi:hypothetical protein Cpir12675_001013 [Ceratocystis pirilliformis]|uniref:Uncharacterized protein n=1 Tax=Ceratocystis pirilliformis TaxID=259994 RepID=A0ABR3ZJJ0_9PEZI
MAPSTPRPVTVQWLAMMRQSMDHYVQYLIAETLSTLHEAFSGQSYITPAQRSLQPCCNAVSVVLIPVRTKSAFMTFGVVSSILLVLCSSKMHAGAIFSQARLLTSLYQKDTQKDIK